MDDADAGTWISAGVVAPDRVRARDACSTARSAARAARRPPSAAGLSREGATRLRFVRRLLYAAIIADRASRSRSRASPGSPSSRRSLLASGAIAAAIIGFAARQTLANFIAGIMLAITQPIRVGDWVTFEGNYGVVEDVQPQLHGPAHARREQRIVIPNEKLAGGSSRTTRWWSTWSRSTSSSGSRPRPTSSARSPRSTDETGQDVTRRRGRPVGHAAGRRQRSGAPARQRPSRSGAAPTMPATAASGRVCSRDG